MLGNRPIGNDQHFNRDENNKAVKPPKIGFMFKAFSKLFIEVFFLSYFFYLRKRLNPIY